VEARPNAIVSKGSNELPYGIVFLYCKKTGATFLPQII